MPATNNHFGFAEDYACGATGRYANWTSIPDCKECAKVRNAIMSFYPLRHQRDFDYVIEFVFTASILGMQFPHEFQGRMQEAVKVLNKILAARNSPD